MKKELAIHLTVVFIYALVTLIMSWPVAMHISDRVIGTGGDPWQTMWRFKATALELKQATKTDSIGAYVREEILGGGKARLVNLSVWPWLPLQAVFGQPMTYNVIWFLSFVLSGYACFLLARSLPTSPSPQADMAAFVTGLYYMFLPYHTAHAQGHFGAMQMQWIPLILFAGLSLWRRWRWSTVAYLFVLLVIQAWSEHHYILWLTLFAVMAGLYYRKEIGDRLINKSNKLRGLAVLVILAVGIVVPYLPTLRLAGQHNNLLNLGKDQTVRFSADIFSFVLPAISHPVWGSVANRLFTVDDTFNASEATQYLGLPILLFLIFFHQSIPARQKKFWLIIAGIFGFIALGPYVKIAGKLTTVPLPYDLLAQLPVFSAIRTVGRAGVFIGLAMAILLFWLLLSLVKRKRVYVLISAIILVDFLFLPQASRSAKLSTVYQVIKNQAGTAIIELPAATNYVSASQALYASLAHGKTVLGDIALERAQSSDEFTEVKSAPGIRQLLYLRTTELRRDKPEFFNQALPEALTDTLKYFKVGTILLHTDSLGILQTSALRSFLEQDMGFQPHVYQDDIAYFFDPNKIGVPADGVFIMRDSAFEHVGFDPKRNSVFAEIPTKATITIVNVNNVPKKVTLVISVPQESPASLVVSDGAQADVTTQANSQTTFTVTVPTGQSRVTFSPYGNGYAIIQNPQFIVENLP